MVLWARRPGGDDGAARVEDLEALVVPLQFKAAAGGDFGEGGAGEGDAGFDGGVAGLESPPEVAEVMESSVGAVISARCSRATIGGSSSSVPG